MKYVQKWKKEVIQLVGFLALLGTGGFGMFAQADMVYVANYDSNTISVIDSSTNSVINTIPVGKEPSILMASPKKDRIYYVQDNNTVGVIDVNTNTVTATIPVGTNPYYMVFNPSGTRLYVSNYSSNNVSVIDTNANQVIATIPVGTNPHMIVSNSDGTRVYVTTYEDPFNDYRDSVYVIDATTNTVITTILVGQDPNNLVINPDGTRVYVTNHSSNTVSVIDTATNEVIATIDAMKDDSPDILINPSGTRVYVTSGYEKFVSAEYDKYHNYVTKYESSLNVIDTSVNNVIARIPIEGDVYIINPSGSIIYASNWDDGNIKIIDTSTNSIAATIAVSDVSDEGINSMAISPDGTKVYATVSVTDFPGRVSVIDANRNTVIATIPVGNNPWEIVVIDSPNKPNNASICNSVTEIPVSEYQLLRLNGNSIKATGVFASTNTKFYGGVSKDRTNYQSYLTATPSSSMTLKLCIMADSIDIRKQADLLWVVGIENNAPFDGGVDTTYFVMDEMGSPSTVDLYNQPTVWMNQLAEKPFKRNVTLQKETAIDEINLGYSNVYPGVNYYFIGYRLQDGTLVYSQTPIIANIQ